MKEHKKTFAKLILEEDYETYEKALLTLQLETLDSRRKTLSLSFAKRSLADGKLRDLFPLRRKDHDMKTTYNYHAEITQ